MTQAFIFLTIRRIGDRLVNSSEQVSESIRGLSEYLGTRNIVAISEMSMASVSFNYPIFTDPWLDLIRTISRDLNIAVKAVVHEYTHKKKKLFYLGSVTVDIAQGTVQGRLNHLIEYSIIDMTSNEQIRPVDKIREFVLVLKS